MCPASSATRTWTARSRRVELRPRLEQIELRANRLGAQRTSGGLVIATPQPAAKSLAPDWPGFAVTIDQEIGIDGAGGGVKELAARPKLGEHDGRRQAGA